MRRDIFSLVAFVWFFSNGCFQIFPQIAWMSIGIFNEYYSYWLHLFDLLHCAFSNISSDRLNGKRHIHIDCICLIFHPCVFFTLNKIKYGLFFILGHKELFWIKKITFWAIFLPPEFRGGETHTWEKAEFLEIISPPIFWIFRQILGWERDFRQF